MLIGAIVVPVVVGIATLFVDPADRPKGADVVRQILRGYPLCAVLAVVLVPLGGVGIARFAHHHVIGWSDEHVRIVVHPGGYQQVVDDLERAIDDADLAVDGPRAPPARPSWTPPGSDRRGGRPWVVADRPVRLVGHDLEVGGSIGHRDRWQEGARRPGEGRDRDPVDLDGRVDDDEPRSPGDRDHVGGIARRHPPPRTTSRPNPARALPRWTADSPSLPSRMTSGILYRQRLQAEGDLLVGDPPGEPIPGEGSGLPVPAQKATRRLGPRARCRPRSRSPGATSRCSRRRSVSSCSTR